jgi:hypothetical protein
MNIPKIEAPALDHDKMMAEKYGQQLHPRMKVERRVVANLIHVLQHAGFWVYSLYDGEETTLLEDLKVTPAEALKATMELAFNLDECRVYFRHPEVKLTQWVYLVFGNDGWDAVCDYSAPEGKDHPWRKVMDAFNGEDYV